VSLSSVPISMVLSDCMYEVAFVSCFSQSALSGSSHCGIESLFGVAFHNNLSLASGRGFYPSFSSSCRLSWHMYDQEFFSTSIRIFERVLYASLPASISFPDVQEVFILGNNFSASQAMLHGSASFGIMCINFSAYLLSHVCGYRFQSRYTTLPI
jgi:hypothetical protein